MKKIPIVLVLLLVAVGTLAGAQEHDLALVGGKLYSSPTSDAIENAVVLIHNGTITAAGKQSEIKIPQSAQRIDCTGKVITAGFWNSHVHFETGWENAGTAPAASLETHMQEMLTQWGVTTVWDLGSNPQNTFALRKRIESWEVPGPAILMAGDIFPKGGHPVYLPAELQLTEAAGPEQSGQEARAYMQDGMDGIKLFTGAYMGDKPVVNMDAATVKAAVDVAHAQGKPVFTHPQNRAGVDNALTGGVDVLAHTIPNEGSFTEDELARMKRHHVGLSPTLTLWTTVVQNPEVQNRLVQAGIDELKAYFSAGGTILFGTDVGFQTKYDTALEYEFMGRAMPWRDILASLTTNPSDFFKAAAKGRVEKGMEADLVVLDGDPAADVRNLAKVAYTIRQGKVIYSHAAR
jgi:imidazolonepropionase-like amidohydrolase